MKSYKLLIINLILILTFLLLQPIPTKPDPNDSLCLTQLHSSFQNPTLKNWSTSFFTNPCYNGFDSYMVGLTCNNGRIFRISLPNMSLHGTISLSITKCTNLQTLDLSSNFLSGNIPTNINDLTNLAVLNLSYNKLTGNIPPTLYLCAYLNVITLQHNLLVGQIPQQLGLLARLSTFDVSYNELEGMIPSSLGNRSGNLVRFNESDFRGNKGLFGYPLQEYKRDRGLSVVEIVGIGLGSGVLSLVISFAIVCVWLKVSEHKLAVAEQAKINHLMPDY